LNNIFYNDFIWASCVENTKKISFRQKYTMHTKHEDFFASITRMPVHSTLHIKS